MDYLQTADELANQRIFWRKRHQKVEHDYFEDAINEAIKEETRWKISELYTAILQTYDNEHEDCLYKHTSLLTAYKGTGDQILLALRKAYNTRFWQLIQRKADQEEDEIGRQSAKNYNQQAAFYMSDEETNKITLTKFNNQLDQYKLDECSMRWIVSDLFSKLF